MDSIDTTNVDSIVKSVLNKFVQRSIMGKKKYGTDLDRNDLHVTHWITHAQDELMDAILYLEKLKVTTK
jgi:cellobiose-specific phosphotransferase system component IIA